MNAATEPAKLLLEGSKVEIKGLQGKPELNGQRGTITAPLTAKGRWPVRVDGAATEVTIKPDNLVALTGESMPSKDVVTARIMDVFESWAGTDVLGDGWATMVVPILIDLVREPFFFVFSPPLSLHASERAHPMHVLTARAAHH